MSPSNPNGWKLEDLLQALRLEVQGKCLKIAADDRPVAKCVLGNNRAIMQLLAEAETLQRDSIASLDAFAPNQGPTGTPRIGEGSDPATVHTDRVTR